MKIALPLVRQTALNALRLLKNSVYSDPQHSGWHHYLNSQKVGNVATAQALLAFHYWNEDCVFAPKALATLKSNQIQDSGEPTRDGGWSFVTNATRFPTVEATSWTLMGLNVSGVHATTEVEQATKWLLSNRCSSSGRKVWGSTQFDDPRIYATSLALRALTDSAPNTDVVTEGVRWLMERQNSDGGWGARPGDSSTPFHSAQVALSLQSSRMRSAVGSLDKALIFLLDSYSPQNLWVSQAPAGLREDIEVYSVVNGKDVSDGRVTFYHSPNAWAVTALITCGRLLSDEALSGVNWIIDSCEGGAWRHVLLQGDQRKPLWAIHDSILALHSAHSRLSQLGNVKTLHFNGKRAKVLLEHAPSRGRLRVFIRKHGRKIQWTGLCVASALGILSLLKIPYAAIIGPAAGAVVLGILTNWLTPRGPSDKEHSE